MTSLKYRQRIEVSNPNSIEWFSYNFENELKIV